MNKDALLVTRPNHDITTIYLYDWAKAVIGEAEKRNFIVYDLKDKKANRTRFEGIINKTEPGLIFINGHGNELLKGHAPQISYNKSQEAQNKTIKKLLSSEAPNDSKSLLPYLVWNRNNQACIV